MVDYQTNLLYAGLGFFGGLYVMSHFRFLRPSNAKALSLQDGYLVRKDKWTEDIDTYREGNYIGERPS